jgi:TRAP-type uncharacterized transport system substrate-binding protein
MELGALKTEKTRTWGVIGLGLLAAALLAWSAHSGWAAWCGESTTSITVSAGPLDSRRSKMVEFLADRGHDEKVAIKLVATESPEEAFRMVAQGKLDAAFVYNAVDMKHDADVCTVAGLPLEPLHVVVRKDLVARDPFIKTLLANRRVNIGVAGSAESLLAQELLAFLKLKPIDRTGKGDYTALTLSTADLFKLARAVQSAPVVDRPRLLADMPDAAILTAALPSAVVQSLLDTDAYVLVPFPFAQAFCMDTTTTEKTDAVHINRLYLEPTEIVSGTYMSGDASPSRACATLGMRLVLVANKNASRPAIGKLTSVVMNSVTTRILKAVDPRTVPSLHEPHPGAVDYLDRDKPLVVQKVMDRITQSLSIFGAFSAGFLTLYGLWRARRMKSPQNYFGEIRKISLMARGEGEDPQLPSDSADRLRVLDERLMLLRLELISDFCQGRFKSELMLLNLLTSIADARRELSSPMGPYLPRRDDGRKPAAFSAMDLLHQAG